MPNSFIVTHGAIRLRVKVLSTIADVTRSFKHEYKDSPKTVLPKGMAVYAFFAATGRKTLTGELIFCLNSRLFELVPHEVYHAVRFHYDKIGCDDEEKIATAIGCLSARILHKLDDGD